MGNNPTVAWKEKFKKTNIFHINTRVNLIHVTDENKVLHQTLVLNPRLMELATATCAGHTYATIVFLDLKT